MFISRKEWRGYNNIDFLTLKLELSKENIKSGFSIKGSSVLDICIEYDGSSIEEIKKKFPSCCRITKVTDKKNQKYLSISRADITRCKDEWINNPFRKLAKEESDVHLLATLFSASANGIDQQNSPYINFPEKYQHDQRVASGRKQQFLNWFYSEDGYPGRVDQPSSYYIKSKLKQSPVIFLDPVKHLGGKFKFEKGKYEIQFIKDSPLHKAIVAYNEKTPEQAIQLEGDDNCIAKLHYAALEEFTKYLLGDGKETTEADLVDYQQRSIISHKADNHDSNSGASDDSTEEAVEVKELQREKVIQALDKVLHIFCNKDFFKKFTKDKGVLQAEIYYTWFIGQVHTAKKYFTEEKKTIDPDKFQCLFNEIDELLLIHDFLTFKTLNVRDAKLLLTKKEVDDLFCKLLTPDGRLIDAFMNDPVRDMLKISETDREKVKDALGDFIAGKTQEPTSADEKVNMLSPQQIAKKNRQDFIGKLKAVASPDISLIETSTTLRIKQFFYNAFFYIPILSLLCSWLNPANNRVVSNYKRDSLYCKNREIYETDASKEIRSALNIKGSDKKYVPSKHEAKCLIAEFRRERNIMGAKEKFIFKVRQHRLLWLTACVISSLIIIGLSITSRVLLSLHIVPVSPVNTLLTGVRGLFESSLFIFGLDTFLDLILLRVVDFVAVFINYVDRYLLGSLLRGTIRLIIGIATDIFSGVKNGIKVCLQSYVDHGFVGSLSIAVDNVRSSLKEFEFSQIKNIPSSIFKYVRSKIFFPEDYAKKQSVGCNIPLISLFFNGYYDYKQWSNSRNKKSALSEFSPDNYTLSELLQTDKKLECDKRTISTLKGNIGLVLRSLQKDGVADHQALETGLFKLSNALQGGESKTIKESHEALKNLAAAKNIVSLNNVMQQQVQISCAKRDWKNFAQTKGAIVGKMPDYAHAEIERAKSLCHDLKLNNVTAQLKDVSTIKNEIARKHNVINHLIERIKKQNIVTKHAIAEPVFNTNQQLTRVLLSLECYRSALQSLHSTCNAQDLVLLECLNHNFRRTFSDAFYLVNKGMNELHYSGLHSAMLSEFSNEFAYYIHNQPSSEIKDITSAVLLYYAKISPFVVGKKHFIHFLKEHQELKRLVLCGLLMSVAYKTPLKGLAAGLTNSFESAMHKIPLLDLLHTGIYHDNYLAEIVEELYTLCELPRDVMAAALSTIHTVSNTEEACEHDHHDHHGSYSAEIRVKSSINMIVTFIFYILGINSLRSIAVEYNYNKKQVMQKLVIPYISVLTIAFAFCILLSDYLKWLKPRPIYIMASSCGACCVMILVLLLYSHSLESKVLDCADKVLDLQEACVIDNTETQKKEPEPSNGDSGLGTSVGDPTSTSCQVITGMCSSS